MKVLFCFTKDRLECFRYAFSGLRDIFLTEHNAWVHAFTTLSILYLTWWLGVGAVKFVLILIFICLVWIAESFNTVLEIVIDIVSPEYNHAARRAKDIAAAAVLFASMGALTAGLVILGPPLAAKTGLF